MFPTWITLLFIYVVFPFKLTFSSKCLQRDSNFRFAHFIDHLFHVLDVLELESSRVTDRNVCLLRCLKDQRCFSTNLGAKPDINGNYVCELLSTDKYNTSITDFKASQHLHHYRLKTPCLSNPCLHNSSCRALYQLNDYWCHCLPNYFGKQCEKYSVELPSAVCMHVKGDRPGVFFTPMAGKIFLIRLVDISGELACSSQEKGKWGCGPAIITDNKNNVVHPEDHIVGYYGLPGFTPNSPEMILTFTTPLIVTAGQEYRVWQVEDLLNGGYEIDNSGQSCMKVVNFQTALEGYKSSAKTFSIPSCIRQTNCSSLATNLLLTTQVF